MTDIFEPGSTIKAFTVASALESGLYKPRSVINTSPGWMRVGHNLVQDAQNNGLLTMAQILQISSNMGAAKLVLSLPSDQLWSLLHRVGFGQTTNVGFPGEQSGSLNQSPWGSFMLATLSFGYGMSVTALQLARAYAILANDGVKIPVTLLKVDKIPAGERVLNSKLSKQMLTLLETVVTIRVKARVKKRVYPVIGSLGKRVQLGWWGCRDTKNIAITPPLLALHRLVILV